MADIPEQSGPARPTAETPSARDARLRWEAASLARGLAEVVAGLLIEDDDLEAWFNQLDVDENAPMPKPKAARHNP
jgi:predicted transcriptional regulator